MEERPEPFVALAVFAKAPAPGRAKTRLAPALGMEGAARLYEAFLRDTLALAESAEFVRATLYAASEEDLAGLAAIHAGRTRVQRPGDLGTRMTDALARGLEESAPARSGASFSGQRRRALGDGGAAAASEDRGRALVIGSDAPTLPLARLRAATAALDRHDVVFGPTPDGGYYLVGARVPFAFGEVRWSTAHTLGDSLESVRSQHLSCALIEPWSDVDVPADLALLEAHLARRPSDAPATAARLRELGRLAGD